jgi:ABC-type nitrate/sulfonate/bicarbonate transport system ATPase subunit
MKRVLLWGAVTQLVGRTDWSDVSRDLIDLWIEGRLPIKLVLLVTHNIEEAVLMCDHILICRGAPWPP